MTLVDSKKYGLSSRVILKEIDAGHIVIVKQIKSRIVMKTAYTILEQVNKIKSVDAQIKVSLLISGSICSKTVNFLQKNQVEIISDVEHKNPYF